MKRVKVIINYADLSVPHVIEFSRNTVNKMTANTTLFPTPDVTLANLTTSVNALETKFNAAQGGGKQQTIELNQAHKALLELLRKQAMYIERIANGNELTIVSSGFDASKQPSILNYPDFSVSNSDNEGEVILRRKVIPGVRSWVWEQCNDPMSENQWEQIAITTQASLVVKDLDTCKRYWFRSAGINKDGQLDWSDPLVIIVT